MAVRTPSTRLTPSAGSSILDAPETTLPAISALRDDSEGRSRFVAEFISRSNDYLQEAEQRVNDQVDDADELLDPDWKNNRNRAYKAPLSSIQSMTPS